MSRKPFLTVRETVLFALLGTLMFVSKVIMEGLPNIHPLALLILACTAVYRSKALIPVYVFVLLQGIVYGFGLMWVPYLYIWTILWALGMLVPRRWSVRARVVGYIVVAVLHGLSFGTLYAPFWALAFHTGAEGIVAYIVSGFPWDLTQAAGNAVFATLVVPLSNLLIRFNKGAKI